MKHAIGMEAIGRLNQFFWIPSIQNMSLCDVFEWEVVELYIEIFIGVALC